MLKPIIDIDVNSEPFQRFQRLFEQYTKDVSSVNAEWRAAVANSNLALKPLSDYAERASKAYQRLSVNIERTGHAMGGLVKTGAAFAKTVERITGFFLKWGSIGGLGTAFGLFGVDRLANSVLERARSAAGAGLSVGQQSSFTANMSPLLGSPSSFLGNVANARQDVTKWWALQAMGINPFAAQNEGTFDLGLQVEARARDIFKRNPNLQMAQAMGLTQFLSPEDLRRLGAMSDKEFTATQAATRRDVGALSFTSQATKDWTELSVELHKAGLEIERVFVEGLHGIAPDLAQLAEAVAKALDAFMKSPEIKEDIDGLAQGIGDFAHYLASPEFKANVKEFADDIGYMARKIVDGLKLLGLIPSQGGDQNQSAVSPLSAAKVVGGGAVAGALLGGPVGAVAGAAVGAAGVVTANKIGDQIQDQVKKFGGFTDPQTGNWIAVPDLLQKMAYVESGGNPNAVSKKGAMGLMQLMPGTARHYGVDPFNPEQSLWAGGMELRRLVKKYGGDVKKAEAAYNWGDGNLDRDIAKYGANWRAHLPKETSDYLNKLNGGDDATEVLRKLLRVTRNNMRRPPPAFTLNNNTSGLIAVQANNAVSI